MMRRPSFNTACGRALCYVQPLHRHARTGAKDPERGLRFRVLGQSDELIVFGNLFSFCCHSRILVSDLEGQKRLSIGFFRQCPCMAIVPAHA